MTVKFGPHDTPIAYSMIEAANKLDPKRDWYHPFHRYFYFWVAFNNIYTIIAYTGSKSPKLVLRQGIVVTEPNGNVNIPKINRVASERDEIDLAFEEFDNDLKHTLIVHPSTDFFVNRSPFWQNHPVPTDVLGQRLNGVLNVNYTVNTDYPVWSPIDFQSYAQYLGNPGDDQARNLLAKQIVEMLYTVRCNLMHGGKRHDDRNDLSVVENALPLLQIIVSTFTQ